MSSLLIYCVLIEFFDEKPIYTSCYCEENVYHLCKTFNVLNDEMKNKYEIYACFISNENRKVPIWKQRASKFPDGIVIWDYHVILIVKEKNPEPNLTETRVYDLDTTLSFPCDFSTYTKESFKTLDALDGPNYHRKFRIIPAETYLRVFASDRSHMIEEDGTWFAPPPTYSPITTLDSVNNLQTFIDMTENLDSKDFAPTLAISTVIFIGIMSLFPVLYLLNFYFCYKRHQAATPWSIEDKVVAITGASSGIGEALAYEFAAKGARLILCARRTELLANIAKECEKLGAKKVDYHKVDVTRESDVVRLIESVDVTYDKIDCLVLNAGVSMGEPLTNLDEFHVIKDIMDVNYFGAAMLTYHSLPLLKRAEKSRIVVVSSLAGIVPIPLRTGYVASKFALRGFYESLQSELIDDNIFITIAYPGVVRTEINKNRLGTNPKHLDFDKGMSAQECASAIVDGAVNGQKEIVFTNLGKLGRLIEGVFPDLLAYASYKKSKTLIGKDSIE